MPRSIGPGALAFVLAACTVSPQAPTPAGEPTALPPATPTPIPAASTPGGVPRTTPLPTVVPTAVASPTQDLSAMDLEAIGCPGGVVLHWTASLHPDFHHYVALRSPEFDIETAYPPIAPAVDWGDTYATDPFVTSAVDSSILPSSTTWYYRVMAYDVDGTVVGASPVRGGRISPVDLLGPISASPADDGQTSLTWAPYRGRSGCFTTYRVLYGTGGTASTLLATVSDQAQAELLTDALAAGRTYTVRVDAVRVTTLGTFVTGRTDTATITLP
jgi:hypothetical protein